MVDMTDQFAKQCGSSECYSNSGVQQWQESLAQTNKAPQVTTCWKVRLQDKSTGILLSPPTTASHSLFGRLCYIPSHSPSSSEMLYGLCKSPAAAM